VRACVIATSSIVEDVAHSPGWALARQMLDRWPLVPARNAMFLAIAVMTALRRLLPPY
jgi:7-cyano-7-deazaguanine synthase in queuosine biosynthesis